MERPNSFETNHESDSGSGVNFMKSILRMAPVLTSVLAMAACADKEELNKCQIEVAGLQGALEGVGVKHEAPKVDDLQECKIEKSKLDGIMEGWKLTHPEIKPNSNAGSLPVDPYDYDLGTISAPDPIISQNPSVPDAPSIAIEPEEKKAIIYDARKVIEERKRERARSITPSN